jgi:hypothetical protein
MDAGANGTAAATAVGALLAFIAVTFSITAAAVAGSIGVSTTLPRRFGGWLAVLALVIVAAPSASAAGWLFWNAHQGRFAPYASVRADARSRCQSDADFEGLTGSAKRRYVDGCVERAVASAAND